MFSRNSTTERTSAQAWDYLSSAMAAVGDTAKDAGAKTAGLASSTADLATAKATAAGSMAAGLATAASKKSSKLAKQAAKRSAKLSKDSSKLVDKTSKKADVAWARANAAANALSGAKPPLPWGLIFGVGLLGAALGWAAATTARAALERRAENEELELAETAVVVTPTYES